MGLVQINYIRLSELNDIKELSESVSQFINDNPHNNGWAYCWYIHNPKDDNDYDESTIIINNYFISLGLKINDEVIIHHTW